MNPQTKSSDAGREEGAVSTQSSAVEAPAAKPLGPQPTIGRIVLYLNPVQHGKPELIPAIVQNVAENGAVRLHVFAAHLRKTVEAVPQGELEGQWSWPKRD